MDHEQTVGDIGHVQLILEHDEVRYYLHGRQLSPGDRLDVLDKDGAWISGRFNDPKSPGAAPTLFCTTAVPGKRGTSTVRFIRLGPDAKVRWTQTSS